MTMPKLTLQNVLASAGVLGILVGLWAAIGGVFLTPAEVRQAHDMEEAMHVEEFHDHLIEFDNHVAHAEPILDAQMTLTCMKVGADTLAMMGVIGLCGDLGVNR